ncbi:ComEC/Rec2 family competence protein [Corynebacterium sp.]|uniref:ComEC/Rec2 family competence protein n=1 Tax=Corynebacterium sp. TaxID=1720 RepID=UPI0026DC94AF|nr:ComEC/Rec2 family competence protein [Corynebacterium sp.]MDO5031075.1 ComEC/Rec2 family competence protein [Corynebacterium sp.]
MRELRLVPAAVAAWLATLAVAFTLPWLVLVGAAAAAFLRPRGQAILCAASACLYGLLALVRTRRADAFAFGGEVTGRVLAAPTEVPSGWLLKLTVPGYPAQLPVFVQEQPAAVSGSIVQVSGEASPSDRPGVAAVVFNGEVTASAPPQGWAGFAAEVAQNFREVCSDGLIPGMVLGDTSLQSPAERQLYVDTGLSHLSAVSGSNVAIVCSAAALLVVGPRARVAASLCALLLYVGLVGWEPSVQRATVAGLAGLAAVLGSARMEPLHALSLGVLSLLAVDSDLAVSFGFALSVAATAGIVVLSPRLVGVIAHTGWPHIVVRAVAVALAADIVTMPLIALMAGQVSGVSVLANVLAAPVVAPITVVGLVAAIAAQLGPLAVVARGLVALIEPLSGWIHLVATGCSRLPHASIATGPIPVLLLGCWVLAGVMYLRPLR